MRRATIGWTVAVMAGRVRRRGGQAVARALGSVGDPAIFGQREGTVRAVVKLAADMDARDRRRIIEGFLIPAAIQMRNHTFGLGSQQDA